MKLYQLMRDGKWFTQNRVTEDVAEKTRVVLNAWGRIEGTDYRMWEEGRAEAAPKVPRVRKARTTAKAKAEAATETVEV